VSAAASTAIDHPGARGLITRHRLRWWEALPWIIALGFYFAFPDYLGFGAELLAMILFALSLDLALGYAGIVTLGHAAFFGAGAYTVGMLAFYEIWTEPITSLLLAALVAAIIGFLSGLVLLRTRGLTLLMLTLCTMALLQEAAKATLAAAKLRLGYTKIVAPFDGVTGERQVQPGDYVNIGSNLINVVPLPNVYVMANYKETQLTRVRPGQPVEITIDSFPNEKLRGRVERIAPASGSQFALLPPDNATGNFTKVVQRVSVRIQLDKNQPLLERLLPGMSVVTNINTGAADGGK